jgi:two-component system NtrC family sensor kinase
VAAERFQALIIDDDPMTARATARGLGRGCDASVSHSAEEGLARLRAGEQFDLVVCDVMMPGMKGSEFFADAVALSPELRGRIVLVTGGASAEQAIRIKELGVVCLQKPLRVETLRKLAADVGCGRR